MKPLLLELSGVPARERAEVGQALTLRLCEVRREHHQRAQHDDDEECHQARDLQLEGHQALRGEEDLARNQSAEQRALGEQDWRERVGTPAQKAEPGRSVRVSGNETELDSRDPPQKGEPEEESKIPAQQDELKQRKTDEQIPV